MPAKWKVIFETSGALPSVRNIMDQALVLTAAAARQEWIRIARQRLRGTASLYISNIGQPEIKRNSATIRLRADTSEGKLANMLEVGAPAFDIKVGLLKSPKVSRTKGKEGTRGGAPYIRVPFQLKTPGGGERGPTPPVMPRPIYRMASQLQFGEQLKLPKKYEDYSIKTRLSSDLTKWGHYTWKASPFEGIVRTRKWPGELPTTPAGRRAAYMTFRTVSRNSDPSSWIHPGFRARNCIEAASARLEQIFPEIIERLNK